MSDTPITDANVCITTKEGCETIAPDICRKFERENAAMREAIKEAQIIQDWADTDTAVREICRKAGIDVDGTPAHVPDIPELVERLAKENAKLRAGLAEAYKLIDVLYMDALDNHKESWPRAREWMELWKEVEE